MALLLYFKKQTMRIKNTVTIKATDSMRYNAINDACVSAAAKRKQIKSQHLSGINTGKIIKRK